MNGKYLLDKMDLIDPTFIDEADKLPRKKPIMWKQWTALAACLGIFVFSGIITFLTRSEVPVFEPSGSKAASVFGTGSIPLIIMGISLLAACGIAAYIIRNKKK